MGRRMGVRRDRDVRPAYDNLYRRSVNLFENQESNRMRFITEPYVMLCWSFYRVNSATLRQKIRMH